MWGRTLREHDGGKSERIINLALKLPVFWLILLLFELSEWHENLMNNPPKVQKKKIPSPPPRVATPRALDGFGPPNGQSERGTIANLGGKIFFPGPKGQFGGVKNGEMANWRGFFSENRMTNLARGI